MRLNAVAMEVWRRRAVQADSSQLILVEATGPAVGDFTPGKYIITAEKDGVKETSPTFVIGFLPVITPIIYRHPASLTVDVGQSAAIYPAAFSHAPMTYEWSKDGTVIAGATNQTLQFAAFSAADVGSYRVKVSTRRVRRSASQLVWNFGRAERRSSPSTHCPPT